MQNRELTPGRYRITAYLRGLDIGVGMHNMTTEFMFNDKYIQLAKRGTFGWTQMTYVADLKAPAKTGPAFGLMAPGMLWVDDVSLERVGEDVTLTPEPVFSPAEQAIEPPGPLQGTVVQCPRCQRRNLPGWGKCYACGTALEANSEPAGAGPAVRSIASFKQENPFEGGSVEPVHATNGKKWLRVAKGFASLGRRQDWTGYDLFKVDTYVDSGKPVTMSVEIRDAGTTDYWTRVNYYTVAPPGVSTLVLSLKQLFVGEKGRPGRHLALDQITRLVFAVNGAEPVFFDNVRVEQDPPPAGLFFDGLYAFDLGPGGSPVMDGFIPVTPATLYDPGRGFGLKNAKIWRAIDALQPDPLYQDFLAIESGGLAIDVPNGAYRVLVNMDSPGGYWGEVQAYRHRAILAQGREVVSDGMDIRSFSKKYFQFWDRDDLPTENTFEKYDRAHFVPKVFDVNVDNGQLNLEFQGQNWGCSVSAVIVFPVAKAAEGERFLEWVRKKRQYYFENSFKRVLHAGAGPPRLSGGTEARGYVVTTWDYMRDLYYNDAPMPQDSGKPLAGEGFAGESEPVTMAVFPRRDLGQSTVTVTALSGSQGTIPASAVSVGYVSYRNQRVTMDGAVYEIAPRLVMPRNSVDLPHEIARQFWLTVNVPATAKPGVYTGTVALTPEKGEPAKVPLRFTVRRGRLATPDIPVGPFGGPMSFPWLGDDPETGRFRGLLTENSLRVLREKRFTMFSGVPYVIYRGFEHGKPTLDFTIADQQMQTVRQDGFMAVSSYGAGLTGLSGYSQDTGRMKAAGFSDYSAFIRAIYAEIQSHARQKGWPLVYWNLADEPIGEALKNSIQNAQAYRTAFPSGSPFFTGATSLPEKDPDGLHFALARALTVPALTLHDEASVSRLLAAGGQWAYYNQGSRWSFGEYLYKAAEEFHVQYRLAWHWNASAGDPYYALDCREDDHAWGSAAPDGQVIPSVEFFRIAAGLTDYRYLLTLARLAKEKAGTPEAQVAERLVAKRMSAFRLGDSERSLPPEAWRAFRDEVGSAIEELSR
jgi:hypothetical protein